MLCRQPAKLAFIAATAPTSWNTTSGGANHTAMRSGMSSAKKISAASRRPAPAAITSSGVVALITVKTLAPVVSTTMKRIAAKPTR